jgi:hypothetical protein
VLGFEEFLADHAHFGVELFVAFFVEGSHGLLRVGVTDLLHLGTAGSPKIMRFAIAIQF